MNEPFNWQEGYGAFTYSRGEITTVIAYINNQEQHHKTNSFKEEYLSIIKDFEIQYDEKYIFDPEEN